MQPYKLLNLLRESIVSFEKFLDRCAWVVDLYSSQAELWIDFAAGITIKWGIELQYHDRI